MIKVKSSTRDYDIRFVEPKHLLEDFAVQDIVVTDENLAKHYKSTIPDQAIVVPAGEASKSFDIYRELISQFAKLGLKRKGRVFAFGGGVVGDLAGFAAASYMRGVELIQIPTSLLAMVDSSVGGKVGIDLPEGKNLVGAFWPPHEVRISAECLKTLPEEEYRNGMAEVIKYGAIMDQNLFEALAETPMLPGDEREELIIRQCIEHKKFVVEEDEFETTGLRAILNFGHTIGHAIEKVQDYKGLKHGEAVAVGMVVESGITEKLLHTEPGTSERIKAVLRSHGLPTAMPEGIEIDELMQAMTLDKKATQEGLAFSVVPALGTCKLLTNINPAEVRGLLEHQ
ncbi:MAG: 3-dehydroquinate synthase [Armatimonadetes bacterium]|nr:3-dehydroquinate synthase [Armatimonadota bacterium]